MPIQPTPLRGPKIVAILKRSFGPTAFPVYHGGAADGQDVRRLGSVVGRLLMADCQRDPKCASGPSPSWGVPVVLRWYECPSCWLLVMHARTHCPLSVVLV